jgi:hypothetical protein
MTTIPMNLDEPCVVCGRPIGEGDDPGFDLNHPEMTLCSEACSDVYFSDVETATLGEDNR